MKIEDHPAFAEKLPRICYILGGEKTPLNNREEFVWSGTTYRVNDGHVEYKAADTWRSMAAQFALENMINNTSAIIRRPRFSDDEKALMRLFVANGRPIFKPDKDEKLHVIAWNKEGTLGNGLPKGLLAQITDRFDAAAYLESEEEK